MIKVKKIVFNPFSVNTFILYDETKECAIIDPGCSDEHEERELSDFIEHEGLKPVLLLSTHSHIDHIAGNVFIAKKYGLKLSAHKDGMKYIEHAPQTAYIYGFQLDDVILPEVYIEEGDSISFGNSKLDVIATPGHADGSVCFISHDPKFVIVGDVLFYQSIGRTDLPGGNYDLLLKNIHEKLFTLGDDYTVYCGHGPETSIGFEKISNPFLTNL